MDLNMNLIIGYGVRVIGVLLVLWIGSRVARAVGNLAARSMAKTNDDVTLNQFVGSLVRWALLVLVGIACLGAFGIETTGFAAIIGAAGLAIGLAFQGTLSSIAAGVMLLIMRPFKVGDVISVGGQVGKVVEITLFATFLDTPDYRRIILPNSAVFGATIENVTFHEKRRVDVSVGTDYTANIAQVRAILAAAAREVPGVIAEPEIVLATLGASSIDWQVRVWCATADYFAVMDATTERVKDALDANSVGIPYNTVDVNVDLGALQGLRAA